MTADLAPVRKTEDLVLDALDEAPICLLRAAKGFGGAGFHGQAATVQYLAHTVGMSDSAVRHAVHVLHRRGLLRLYTGRANGRRRLFITAEAVLR